MYLRSSGEPRGLEIPVMGRITTTALGSPEERGDHILLLPGPVASGGESAGYAGFLSPVSQDVFQDPPSPGVYGVARLDYIGTGDVVLLHPSGGVAVLYRRSSRHNTILTTERCNSYCLMCSQPPRSEDDSYRIPEILRLVELIDPLTEEIGLSGGEPTLLGRDFLRIVQKFKDFLPCTRLHVLTNGRPFKDRAFAEALGAIKHPGLMLGIPLYADVDSIHDYVVQARGAFEETVHGLYNLARAGVAIEIRVVLHAQTYRRLPQLAEYLYWNFPFVAHVALMGMEMFGLVHKNLPALWIDPFDYQVELESATVTLAQRGIPVSIYNHQLCTIPKSLWPFACRSISDWKNVYLDACHDCGVREFCGGFFQSATKRHSAHVTPVVEPASTLLEALRRMQPGEAEAERLPARPT